MGIEIETGKRKGRHPQSALTAAFVKNAKGPGFYADGNGLYLKVEPSGASRWVQRVMVNGKRKDLAIGPTSVVSLLEAREATVDNKRLIRSGGDPSRKAVETIPTFKEAAHTVHELHKPQWRNPKHAAQFISTLETYAFPRIAGLRVSDITSADLMRVLQPIWMEKPETARRVRQRMERVLKWTMAKGWRTDNPAVAVIEGLPKHDTSLKKHRKSLPYTQVADCIRTIGESNAYPLSKLAFECTVLTATRSIEVRQAVWGEVNLGKAVWTIPASRMKMKRDHAIPLAPRVVEIMAEAECLKDGSELVFPSSRQGRPMSDATLLKLVRSKGFDCDVHGFRASFRTWAEEQTSTPHKVAEAALAHVKGDKTEEAYMRSDLFDKRRILMNGWADFLSGNNSGSLPNV
jgi:integrase